MADIILPEIVNIDEDGNIAIHGREGIYFPLSFQDALSAPIDASSYILFFEIKGYVRVALRAGATTDEWIIVLTEDDLDPVPLNKDIPFCLLDETLMVGPDMIADTIWEGTIRFHGFADQPPLVT